jgi:hypothetical protein
MTCNIPIEGIMYLNLFRCLKISLTDESHFEVVQYMKQIWKYCVNRTHGCIFYNPVSKCHLITVITSRSTMNIVPQILGYIQSCYKIFHYNFLIKKIYVDVTLQS